MKNKERMPTIYLYGQNPVLIVKRRKKKPNGDREVLVEHVDLTRAWTHQSALIKFVCPRSRTKKAV